MTGVETFLAANAATFQAVSVAASLAGTAMSAVQGYQQAQAQAARARYEIQQANRNAGIARNNAILERRAGDENAADINRETRRRLSTIRNNLGANGLGVFGSPLEILSDTAIEGALAARREEFGSIQRARVSELEALGHGDNAALAAAEKRNAKASQTSAFFSGGLSMVGTAAKGFGDVSQAKSFSKKE